MNGNSAQVIGKVNPDHSIKVLTSKDVGEAGEYPTFLSLSLPFRLPFALSFPPSPRQLPLPCHKEPKLTNQTSNSTNPSSK